MRWQENRNGHPLFGPDSPIASKSECDGVGGKFLDALDPWMLHANVFLGDELMAIWSEEHSMVAAHRGHAKPR
jgi:hypothetical protein